MPPQRLRLRPGLRTSERTDATLQVGLHPDHRVVLSDAPSVRALLRLLAHGISADRLDPNHREPVRRLADAGLLVAADDQTTRSRARAAALVAVIASEPTHGTVSRMLAAAGLREARSSSAAVSLLVTLGSEPRRADLDAIVRADRPHLLVTAVADRLRIGPCVVPGLTACLRCIDEHLTDRDPRYPLVLEQHLDDGDDSQLAPVDLQLGLAWAVRDLVSLVEGDRPTTWSATVDLEPGGPVTHGWRRHPRCGCAWADLD